MAFVESIEMRGGLHMLLNNTGYEETSSQFLLLPS